MHYVRAGDSVVAEFTRVDDGNPATDRTRYLHRDHLGSVALVTDEAGNVAEDRSFGPWGQARNADWSTPAEPPALLETPRGFGGHEHIQTVGLVHMNGRVYDPKIGRFMSPDPSDALDPGVGFNRYAYVRNNPVSLTDPSGYFGWAGAAIGAGLEFAAQVLEGKWHDLTPEKFAKNFAEVAVAGAVGFTGAGIAKGVARLTASIAERAIANGVVGATLGAGSKVVNNAIEGNELTEGIGKGAAWGPALAWPGLC